ncbi:MAG: O-antigen ligase family protein, partial [Candidatus Zixiibacteriota bacterium]
MTNATQTESLSHPAPAAWGTFRALGSHHIVSGGLALCLGAFCAAVVTMQASYNLYFFAFASLGLAFALAGSLHTGAMYSLLFFCIKPAVWRLAYHLDATGGTHPAVDLLRYSGGLFLSLICAIIIVKHIVERRPLIQSRLDLTLALFIVWYTISIFNPQTSLFLGLAGFERNIFPTLFLFFVGREIMNTEQDLTRFIKVVTVFAIVALAYGLKHSLSGLWGFEQTFFTDKFYSSGLDGWLTVGIKGIEFRTFGAFYGYMEFTFTAALWGALLLAQDFRPLGKRWRTAKWMVGALLVALLVSSLERTPIMMVIAGLLTVWYVRSEKRRRVRILVLSGVAVGVIVFVSALFQRQLEATGVAKLQRLSEITDPASASSIQDRIDRMWTPTVRIILANPIGVGSGYGSQTVATASAAGSQLAVQPHNEFLQKALETGWPGAALFAVSLGLIFHRLMKSATLTDNRTLRNAAAAGCGIVAAFVLCGQVNLPFSGASGSFFWFTSGALISLTGKRQRRTLPPSAA